MSAQARFTWFVVLLMLLSVTLFIGALAVLPDILTAPDPVPSLRWGGDQCSFDPIPPCKNWRP